MQRIDTADAAAALPTPAAAGTPGYFTGGNPATNTPATTITADFLNMVQEELATVALADGGAALDKTNHGQVLANIRLLISAAIAQNIRPQVRQTILSAAVDSNGLPNFLSAGSGLSVSIAATAVPIVVTAAGGAGSSGPIDRIGYISADTSISGLTDSATNYLYMDIAANGTVTLGATTLAPVTQFGGTYSTTSGQFTFNIQEMTGKVGNGSTASQTYRYYFGEAVAAGGVITSVVTYALMGRYESQQTSFTINTAYSVSTNLGVTPRDYCLELVCQTSDSNYQPGTIIRVSPNDWDSTISRGIMLSIVNANTMSVATGSGYPYVPDANGGGGTGLTAGRWKFRVRASRGW